MVKKKQIHFLLNHGQSEHQTGLAFDINSTNDHFKDTNEGKWLNKKCYEHGFIIRYPQNKEYITGYIFEPWHIRYVGKKVALEIKSNGMCLEEYLETKNN